MTIVSQGEHFIEILAVRLFGIDHEALGHESRRGYDLLLTALLEIFVRIFGVFRTLANTVAAIIFFLALEVVVPFVAIGMGTAKLRSEQAPAAGARFLDQTFRREFALGILGITHPARKGLRGYLTTFFVGAVCGRLASISF
jgi:hypothetical protein